MNISARDLGLSLGIVLGLTMLVLALLSMFLGVGTPIVELMGSLYIGFAPSILGGLIGLFFGFIHGYITGALLVIVKDYLINH